MSAAERMNDQDALIALPRDITMPGAAAVAKQADPKEYSSVQPAFPG
jgi:hypothetical protein